MEGRYFPEKIKNNISYWNNFGFANKVFLFFGLIIALAVFIFVSIFLYEIYKSFGYLWIALLLSTITYMVFYFHNVFYVIEKKINTKYPLYLIFDEKGVYLQTKGKKKMVLWHQIYGLSILFSSVIEKLGKHRNVIEYRVYYYDGNKLKWFCVSKEIGERIKKELEKRGRNLKIEGGDV